MTPYKQQYLHDPDRGVTGDCGRTVIACLLDMRPEEVPHFYHEDFYAEEPKDWKGNKVRDEWLRERGLTIIKIPYDGDAITLENLLCQYVDPGVFYILHGRSRNDTGHVVICEGGKIVHDPALDDSGIVGPEPHSGHYWLEFLVPLGELKPLPSETQDG